MDPVSSTASGIAKCLGEYLIPAVPGPTLNRVIEMTLDKERYAADLAPIVMRNSAYAQFVLKLDFLQTRIKDWVAEMPEGQANYRVILERIFILLGKQASRNLLAAIRLARIGNQLPRKKNDRFSPNPKEQLKHALACEEFCENRNYASADLAFLGGLQYDLLLTALTKQKASREVLNAFSVHFPESLRVAHFAYEIGSRMGSIPMSEYAFPAAITLGIGKILAYALYPKEGGGASYAGFLAELEKKTVFKWEFADLEEKRRFALLPHEISALAAANYGFLRRVEPAILHRHEAYFLQRTQPKLYPLALLLGLAEGAAAGRAPKPAELEGLRGLRVNPSILAEAAKAVAGKGKG